MKNQFKNGVVVKSIARASVLLLGLGLVACEEDSNSVGPEVSSSIKASVSSGEESSSNHLSSNQLSSSEDSTNGNSSGVLSSSVAGSSEENSSTISSSSKNESGKSSSSKMISSSVNISISSSSSVVILSSSNSSSALSSSLTSSSSEWSSSEVLSSSEVSSSSEPYFIEGTLVDTRDQKEYRTVKIGEQTWMGENLNYQGGAYSCRLGVDSLCNTYGALYTWGDAMVSDTRVCEVEDCALSKDYKYPGICPEGWHVPQIEEWKTLFTTMGNRFATPLTTQSSYYNTMTYKRTYYWHDIGEHLKSTSGWESYYTSNGVPGVEYHNGPDLFGFRALWYQEGSTNGGTSWWTPTGGSGGFYRITVLLSGEEVAWSTIENTKSFHIRCVMD